MSLKKCLIIFCLCAFVYGDENATNSATSDNFTLQNENLSENSSSINSASEILNENKENLNSARNDDENSNVKNKQSGQNLSANEPNLNENLDTNDTAQSAENLNPNAENANTNSAQSENDESDVNFDDFEAEFNAFKVNDPLSGYNRMMTRFNVALYTYIMRPVAKGYEFIMPEFVRIGIKNFFSYIAMPIRFGGNVLQFKFKEAGTELKRFGVNTIFGFFGLIDAASKGGIPIYHADFGLVLAHWGVGSGFHFVLPVLGPSNLRDTLSIPVNWYASPITYVATYDSSAWINWLSVGITSAGIINSMSFETQTLDAIFYNTPNLYPFLRDGYEKRRMEMAK